LQIAAKPLQIETWLLLTAYKKLLAPYLMVSSPTPYDLPIRYNTSVTDGWTENRQSNDNHTNS